MSGANGTVARAEGVSTLVRATFASGMLLQHEDLEQMTAYTRELSRLLFSSLFGCGVVCGLVVDTDTDDCGRVCVIVRAGLALDCAGDPVYVPKDQTFVLDEKCDPNIKSPLWVVLCGTGKRCAPRASMCGSDEDEPLLVRTRERDGFEIRVVSVLPTCMCSCVERDENDRKVEKAEQDKYVPQEDGSECKCVDRKCADPEHPCYEAHYLGECGCQCDDCSDCHSKCIILARLNNTGTAQQPKWTANHSVRRFVRPVLMRDPQVEKEKAELLAKALVLNEPAKNADVAAAMVLDAEGTPVRASKPRSRRKSEDEPEA
jgi:hypothetical protein